MSDGEITALTILLAGLIAAEDVGQSGRRPAPAHLGNGKGQSQKLRRDGAEATPAPPPAN